jgi:hypothetical protein
MITQIKLSDGLTWHAESVNDTHFRLVDGQHNFHLWSTHQTTFTPGDLLPRAQAVIVGHLHEPQELRSIQARNTTAAQKRNQRLRSAHFNTALPSNFRFLAVVAASA